MSNYNPPSENLPSFNPSVFSDNFTADEVDTKIKTLETKTTKLSYSNVSDISTFGSQLVIQDTGDNSSGETNLNHQIRLTTGVDDKTMMLGYDNLVDIGYINCSKSGSYQPLCLQTRGNFVGIGLTNPTERLDVDATIKCANLKTANHTDVDGTLTTLNTKTTQITYDAVSTTSTIGATSTINIGGNNIVFNTSSTEKLRITSDAQPTLNIGVDGGTRGSKIQMEGVAGDPNLIESVIETRLYGGTDDSEMVLFKGNDSGNDRIRLRSGTIAFDCYTGDTTDRTAENIRATVDSNGINILTNPIKATSVNTGEDTWDIRIPIQCSLTKTIVSINGSGGTTNIRLPKSIGNFSAGPATAMNYLVNISRSDGDWNTGDRPYYGGFLQLSTFSSKKGRLFTIPSQSYQIESIALVDDGNDVDLQVQLNSASDTSCKITLTQIR